MRVAHRLRLCITESRSLALNTRVNVHSVSQNGLALNPAVVCPVPGCVQEGGYRTSEACSSGHYIWTFPLPQKSCQDRRGRVWELLPCPDFQDPPPSHAPLRMRHAPAHLSDAESVVEHGVHGIWLSLRPLQHIGVILGQLVAAGGVGGVEVKLRAVGFG